MKNSSSSGCPFKFVLDARAHAVLVMLVDSFITFCNILDRFSLDFSK